MEQLRRFLEIIILEEPSEYVFPGEWFEVRVALKNSGPTLAKFDDLTLQTSVYFHEEQATMGHTSDLRLAKLASSILIVRHAFFLVHFSTINF
jgi:hypothetical protein